MTLASLHSFGTSPSINDFPKIISNAQDKDSEQFFKTCCVILSPPWGLITVKFLVKNTYNLRIKNFNLRIKNFNLRIKNFKINKKV